MKRTRMRVIGVITAIVVVAAGFTALSERIYPFIEDLQRADSLEGEVRGNRSSASLRFHDNDHDISLASEVHMTRLDNGIHQLQVRTSHPRDTKLDSLRLRLLFGQVVPNVALETPGGMPWEPIHFQRTTDGQGVLVDVPDLGFQGTGTVVLSFIIGAHTDAEDVPDQIALAYEAKLHRDGTLQLTQYEASTLVEVPMPNHE